MVESLMFTGRTPWHGIGVELADDPDVETAIRAAGLDWKVVDVPLYYPRPIVPGVELDVDPSEVIVSAEVQEQLNFAPVDAKAILRETDKSLLGVVKRGYHPLQNIEAFKFFQPFLDQGHAKLEVAGSLRKGRHIFVLAKITIDPVDIVKGDEVICYLLLANGHDGTFAVWVALTPIRVVCNNTLSAVFDDESTKLLRVLHNSKVKENVEIVRDTVNLARRQFEASVEQYQYMATHGVVDDDQLRAYVRQVFAPKAQTRKNELRKRAELEKADKAYEKVLELFNAGAGANLKGVRGTPWGAYNAINEYLLYVRGRSQDARLNSALFGTASTLDARALKEAIRLATGGGY